MPWTTEIDEETLTRAAGMKRAGIKLKDIAARLGVNHKRLAAALCARGVKSKLAGNKGRRTKGETHGRLFFADVVEPLSFDEVLQEGPD